MSILPREEEGWKGYWVLELEPTVSSRMVHLGQANQGSLYEEKALEAGYKKVRDRKGGGMESV